MAQSRCSVAIIDAVALVRSVGLVDGGVAAVVVAFVIDGALFAAAAVAIDVCAVVAVDTNAVAVCYLGACCCRRFSLLLLLMLMQVYRYAPRVFLAVSRLTIFRQFRI